jgi:hypothetical protein
MMLNYVNITLDLISLLLFIIKLYIFYLINVKFMCLYGIFRCTDVILRTAICRWNM